MKGYKTMRGIIGITLAIVVLGGCAGKTKQAAIAADQVAAHEEMALQLKIIEAWTKAVEANAEASVTTIECGVEAGACAGLKVKVAGEIPELTIPHLTNKHDAAIAKTKARSDFAKYAIGKVTGGLLGWKAFDVLDGRSNTTTTSTTTSGDTSGDVSGDTSGDTSGDVSGDTSGDVSGDTSGDTITSGDDIDVGGDHIAGTQEIYDAGGEITRGDKDQMSDSYNQDNDVDNSNNSDNSDNSDNSVDNSDNSVDDNSDSSVNDNSVVDDHTVNNEPTPPPAP